MDKQERNALIVNAIRQVLEWWTGPDCAATLAPRGDDSAAGIRHALTLAPDSAFLHRWLGAELCKQLPCDDRNVDEDGGAPARVSQCCYRSCTGQRRLFSAAIMNYHDKQRFRRF